MNDYRIVKIDRKSDKITEVLFEDIENIDEACRKLLDALYISCSNFSDYTEADLDAVCRQGGEYINTFKISIEENGVTYI